MSQINDVYIQNFAPLSSQKVLILDRDGTLNRDSGYEHSKENLVILPDAIEFLSKAVSLGFGLIVATNQGGAAIGKFSIDQSLEFNAEMAAAFKDRGIVLSAAYICFHHPLSPDPQKRECSCRKPKPGMLTKVLIEYGLDKNRVFMVGDQESDAQAAFSAGIEFWKIGEQYLWNLASSQLEVS